MANQELELVDYSKLRGLRHCETTLTTYKYGQSSRVCQIWVSQCKMAFTVIKNK